MDVRNQIFSGCEGKTYYMPFSILPNLSGKLFHQKRLLLLTLIHFDFLCSLSIWCHLSVSLVQNPSLHNCSHFFTTSITREAIQTLSKIKSGDIQNPYNYHTMMIGHTKLCHCNWYVTHLSIWKITRTRGQAWFQEDYQTMDHSFTFAS